MTFRNLVHRFLQLEGLNFLLTNRIPRVALTRFMGTFSKIRHPWVRIPSLALFRFFAGPDLSEARKQRFESLHDCFVRELKLGARSFATNPNILCSPSDGIVGAFGRIDKDKILQIKGMPYSLKELLGSADLAAKHEGGNYLTLRLQAGMYHRFHAPDACIVQRVTHIQGDTWNVNPPALKRVPSLYCRNDRAVIETTLSSGRLVTIVPVGAILVASLRLHFLNLNLHRGWAGIQHWPCAAQHDRGQEMGWFEHGSTIILLTRSDVTIHPRIQQGLLVKAGEILLELDAGLPG